MKFPIIAATWLSVPLLHGAVQPYTADANTVHLFHLNEPALSTSAANAGSSSFSAIPYNGNPPSNNATAAQPVSTTILGAAAYPGFGTAANISAAALGLGVDANASGGFQLGINGGASPDAILHSSLAGHDGSFTLEAMVNLPAITGAFREIFCTDNSIGTRGFQFRITTTGNLEFNFIGTAPAAYIVPIPTVGTHGFVANQWFHVALSYDGPSHTTTYYWTRVSAGTPVANVIGTPGTIETTDGNVSAPLVIANEGRSAGSGLGSSEGLQGLIDEVRVSKVARTAGQFIFVEGDSDADGLEDAWEIANFTTITAQIGTGDPDGDGFDNEAEETAGSNPNSAVFTPLDTDGDGLPDQYEVENFGNISSQTGADDFDGDLATNLQEYLSDFGTSPIVASEWPDTDNDGMNDAYEVAFFGNLTKNGDADTDGDLFTDFEEHQAHTNPNNGTLSPLKAVPKNRWSFNGALTDSVGGSTATIVEVGANDVTSTATGVTLTGGARAASDYVSLGTNLLPKSITPVTIELWATQNTVQNWGRIFDFNSGTAEYLLMSWTRGTNLATDNAEIVDRGVTSNTLDKNQPYALGEEYHIVMTLQPLAGSAGRMRVTVYSAKASAADLGPARGSFETNLNLINFHDLVNSLGYSPFIADNTSSATYNEVRIWNGALITFVREQFHDLGPNDISIPDVDNDLLPDSWETTYFASISVATTFGDNDADGVNNRDELLANSNPNSSTSNLFDTDGDGLLDAWEIQYFGNVNAQNGSGDPDNDLVTNEEEETNGTNPTNGDEDNDGLNDGWEKTFFGNVTAQDGAGDPDGDGFTNEQEETAGSNPTVFTFSLLDTDGDNLTDTWEVFYFGSVASKNGTDDPDADGASNSAELSAGSNPTLLASTPADTDGDGIVDTNEIIKPYTADASTLHLWHFDGATVPVADAGTNPINLTSLQNGAVIWSPSIGGFHTALNTAATAASRLGPFPEAADGTDNVVATYSGPNGEFTMEALIRIGFDPAAPVSPTVPMQIISADNEVDPDRIFQFRILPTAGAPVLQFINLHGFVNVQTVGIPIPMSGANAIAQGSWYHVAVTYNGVENTAGNVRLFWTLANPAATQANEITTGTENLAADLIAPAAGADLVIGNEGRSFGGTTDRFFGAIDEVRISSIARSATQFLFGAPSSDSDADGLTDTWEMTYFGNLAQTAAGDFDGDGTSNLTEFRLGLLPNNGSSRFAATRAANGLLTWPSATGLTFVIQRSTDLTVWSDIATVPGTATTASFTDPSPPAGKAFYRVVLQP